MYSRFLTASLYGLSGEKTWVEVDTENGMPAISVVGLANQSIKEAKDRIKSAIVNSGFSFPARKITINLTPANKKKDGSHFDLPIALGVLNSSGIVVLDDLKKYRNGSFACLGELTLDGKINPVDGVLPMLVGLQKCGVGEVIIPSDNLCEAMLVKGMIIFPAKTLTEAANHISGLSKLKAFYADGKEHIEEKTVCEDFADIKGQEHVKRAAQVAAAGMHGLLMIGPPGVGKSMVGKRIPGILPPLSYEEQLEVTQIYSVAGELKNGTSLISKRPFRAPHHSMSQTSLVGGGGIPKPGEISLAHKGVLFLDELPEFSSHLLDMLRQPLEDGSVSIARVSGKVVFPARFMLVAAMNPCKCGYYGDPVKPCVCTESERQHYLSKISGPLLDRIDLHVSLERVAFGDIGVPGKCTSTAELRKDVLSAIEIQKDRYKNLDISYNSDLTPSLIEKYCFMDKACSELLRNAFEKWHLSARSYHRIIKLSRTIADLYGDSNISEKHILEALTYRMPDKYFK